ncbi:MAG: methyltransferase domain-containing protein [Parachlamydiales bacterium]|nr:methyltransferase domain-containing protein [Parachlamydiales bacterium]
MLIRSILLLLFFVAAPIFPQYIPEKSVSKERLSNQYTPQFLRLLQIAFGDDSILSQGGTESVDIMFESIDLNNKKVLDIGSGFGGVEIYLAEKFDLEVIGVDMEPYMVSMAEKFLDLHKNSLVGRVCFHTLKKSNSLSEFKDETFDIIFSKETFYNVPRCDKLSYLIEVYRKLKPEGIVIIADWFQGTPIPGDALKRAATNEKVCQFVTPEAFCKMLNEARFEHIRYEDHTQDHIRYTEEDCERLREHATYITEHFGETMHKATLRDWIYWLEAQQVGELVSGTFFAKKPPKN